MQLQEFIESRQEMEAILRAETLGYLGLASDDGPYVVPLNYSYIQGKVLFHCALTGKKLDHLKKNPNVCFTVARQPGEVRRHAEGSPCHVDSDSVICVGTARIIDDLTERKEALDAFNRGFRPDAEGISPESVAKCGAVVITITEMTGRREREQKRTYWRHRFGG